MVSIMSWILLVVGGWWFSRCKNSTLRRILIVAYILRVALVIEHHFFLPLLGSQADAQTFVRIATTWANKGPLYLLTHVGMNAWLYVWGLAWMFYFFGSSFFLAQTINVLLGVGAVKLVYQASSMLWGMERGRRAAWVAALFPTLLLYSAIPMRESLLIFSALWGIVGWLRWYMQDGKNWRALGQALFGFLLSAGLHTAMFFGGGLMFLLSMAFLTTRRLKRWRISKTILYTDLLIGMVGLITVATGWGLGYIAASKKYASVLVWLQRHLTFAARGGAAYLSGFVPQTWWDIVWMTPIRMLYFLCMPFPWMLHRPQELLGSFNGWIWCLLFLWLFKKSSLIWKREITRILLFGFLGLWFTLAWGVSNYGTSIRHSIKLLPFILVLLPFPKIRFKTCAVSESKSE